jgi:hypothetical protein
VLYYPCTIVLFDEPAPLPYEPVRLPVERPSRAQRALRTGRMRKTAAIALVCALGAGWLVTTRMGRTSAQAATEKSAAAPPATTGRATPDPSLRRLLPVGAECHDQDGSPSGARCSVAGIDVDYRMLRPDSVRAAYDTAIGSAAAVRGRAAAAPACVRGGEEERSWSRPARPGRIAGRYACRVEQGRAAMWWTVDDLGLLAHATAANADLASLFAWWASHSER